MGILARWIPVLNFWIWWAALQKANLILGLVKYYLSST